MPPSTSGASSDVPPSYSEAISSKSSQKVINPDETTALNTGDKMGYTSGIKKARFSLDR